MSESRRTQRAADKAAFAVVQAERKNKASRERIAAAKPPR